jgi:hypothetical protein
MTEFSPELPAGFSPAVLLTTDSAQQVTDDPATAATPTTPDSGDATNLGNRPGDGTASAHTPKLCRGCRAQMPTVCDGCARKTTAYCRTCLNTDTRHHNPPADQHRPDELQQAVTTVMNTNPLPTFGGVTGWTPGRIGAHLPDQTPAAILLALRRLAANRVAEHIGGEPERYRPTH